MRVDGLTALVTGGASGLGAATAEFLVDRGASVVILDRAPPRDPLQTGSVRFIEGDVTRPEDVSAAIESAAVDGTFRACINCAGIPGRVHLIGDDGAAADLDVFRRIIDVNLVGMFNVIRLAVAAMARLEPLGEERGVLVNTASVAASDGMGGMVAYSASKAAIAGMTLPIARELAGSLIRCVTIAPGLFDTPFGGAAQLEPPPGILGAIPHPKRAGRPQEFAALVVHIVENAMLNGDTIRLDAGLRLPTAW